MSNHSETINELAGALAKAQAEFQPAKFNAVNPFLKNKYADLGSVIEAARPALSKNGLSVLQPVTIENGTVTVESILAHSSGQWISSTASITIFEEKGLSVVQVAGKVITYMRRYQFASLVGIYADEDTDGNKQEGKAKDEPKPDFTLPQLTPAAESISYEDACKVTNSKGVAYGEIPNDKLSFMLNSLLTAIKSSTTPEEIAEKSYKRDAIIRILNERASA